MVVPVGVGVGVGVGVQCRECVSDPVGDLVSVSQVKLDVVENVNEGTYVPETVAALVLDKVSWVDFDRVRNWLREPDNRGVGLHDGDGVHEMVR